MWSRSRARPAVRRGASPGLRPPRVSLWVLLSRERRDRPAGYYRRLKQNGALLGIGTHASGRSAVLSPRACEDLLGGLYGCRGCRPSRQ